jgi:hypothetical protein
VVYHNYLGTAAGKEAGLYQFAGNQTRRTVSKGSWISN